MKGEKGKGKGRFQESGDRKQEKKTQGKRIKAKRQRLLVNKIPVESRTGVEFVDIKTVGSQLSVSLVSAHRTGRKAGLRKKTGGKGEYLSVI